MKRKITLILLVISLAVCSAMPASAGSRLERPEIEKVSAGQNSIKVDWTNVKNSDEYDVYRALSSDGKYKYLGTTEESWYRDYEIKKGTRYYYKVRAVSYGEYDNSKLSSWRSGKVKKTASSSYTVSQTVYITDTGSKYHNAGCSYLRQSSHAISIRDAKDRGYTACSRCW